MCGIINNGNQDKIFPKPLTQKSSILQSVFSYIVQLGLWFLHATYVTYVHLKSSLLCKVFGAPLFPQSSFGMIFVHSVFLDFLHLKVEPNCAELLLNWHCQANKISSCVEIQIIFRFNFIWYYNTCMTCSGYHSVMILTVVYTGITVLTFQI